MFEKLGTEGLEKNKDVIGGFRPLETDIYTGVIKVVYAGTSKNGATSLNVIVDLGDREYREILYVTNRKGENFFERNGKKIPLPGFSIGNDLCLIASEKALAEQETEEKVVNVYDPDLKKEAPKNVPVLVGLTGKRVSLGITKELENKNEKQGDAYVAVAETRTVNKINKVFHPELKVTVVEATNKKEATFWDVWLENKQGETIDRRTIKDGSAGNQGSPAKPKSEDTAPKKSLFS